MTRMIYGTAALALMASAYMAAAGKAGGNGKGEAPKFDFEELPIPAKGVFGGRSSEANELTEKLAAVPVGKSFLEEVTVPDSITDAKEREKTFKEEAKRATNRITGAVRRFKAKNAGYEFAIRTVNDDTLGHGVRVWRVKEDGAK